MNLYDVVFFRAKDWNARKASLINMKDNFLQIVIIRFLSIIEGPSLAQTMQKAY